MKTKTYAVSVVLTRMNTASISIHNFLGVRTVASGPDAEDAARGSVVQEALQANPGFAVHLILAHEVG